MKLVIIFSIISNLVFSYQLAFPQTQNLDSSDTKAFNCALNYIESFNKKNTEQLGKYFTFYYENNDLEGRLKSEHSLKKSWGKLKINRIVYDSENEVILLIQAEKVTKSYLLFDIKLKETIPEKIEYFTRTGIPKPEGRISLLTDMEAMYFADRSVPINDTIIQKTINEIAKVYNLNYYMPEIGKNISTMLIDNLNNGKYSQVVKAGRLADSLNADILKVHFDRHSWVEADRRMLHYDSAAGPSQNYGFEEVKILDGNNGYLKFNEFSPLREAQDFASHALDSLANCESLILDLRENWGGYPEMIQFLASYFFPIPVKINTLYDRNGNIINEIWTQDSIPGKRFSDSLPVIILTSNQTASAAEGFVNLFKKTKRAMIIGEPTNGAHHPAKEVIINSLFVVSVPFLRGEDTNLPEGKGIAPDIFISSEMALEKAIEYLRDQ